MVGTNPTKGSDRRHRDLGSRVEVCSSAPGSKPACLLRSRPLPHRHSGRWLDWTGLDQKPPFWLGCCLSRKAAGDNGVRPGSHISWSTMIQLVLGRISSSKRTVHQMMHPAKRSSIHVVSKRYGQLNERTKRWNCTLAAKAART